MTIHRKILMLTLGVSLFLTGCVSGDLGQSMDEFYRLTAHTPTVEPEVTVTATAAQTPTSTPKPTSTPALTPTPTAVPTPSPTPDHIEGHLVAQRYEQSWPEDAAFSFAYDKYAAYPHYFVVLKRSNIRSAPTTEADVIRKASYTDRLEMTAAVYGENDKLWYLVHWEKNGESFSGYIHGSNGSVRTFQMTNALERAERLKTSLNSHNVVYIYNYKNRNRQPPRLTNRKTVDEYGYRRDQAAPGYNTADLSGELRYIPDGMLGYIEEMKGVAAKVFFPTFDTSLWVNIRYLELDKIIKQRMEAALDAWEADGKDYDRLYAENILDPMMYLDEETNALPDLTQMIVVDRKNQNAIVMEYHAPDGWQIISLNFVSTGKSGQYSLPTPLGDFMAIQTRKKFNYYKDGTTEIQGFAPYAVRFSGGGYIHGVPRTYQIGTYGELIPRDLVEAHHSLGTLPKSHMCVRTYTSHALFLYQWVDIGSCAVIVIE